MHVVRPIGLHRVEVLSIEEPVLSSDVSER